METDESKTETERRGTSALTRLLGVQKEPKAWRITPEITAKVEKYINSKNPTRDEWEVIANILIIPHKTVWQIMRSFDHSFQFHARYIDSTTIPSSKNLKKAIEKELIKYT